MAICATSCSGVRQYSQDFSARHEQEMTLGVVQRELYTGMPQADVACIMGSPNIVTRDDKGNETWIYDKISHEVKRSESSGLLLFIYSGCDALSKSSQHQKTLTVIIKFDENGKIDALSYHASKF
jgi:outer membrane protein assembly factor BamE (lipoprotein component of BamABCDE complex)